MHIFISTETFIFDILMLTFRLTDTFFMSLEKEHFLYMYIVFQMIRTSILCAHCSHMMSVILSKSKIHRTGATPIVCTVVLFSTVLTKMKTKAGLS